MMNSWLGRASAIVALVALSLLSSKASAQSEQAGERSTPPWLNVFFEHRSRYEKMTNRFRVDELGPTRVLAFRTRLRFEIQELIDPIRFVVELQDSRSELNDEPLVVVTRHVNKLDFKQVQLQLVTNRFLGKDIPTMLQVGRFTMDLGKRRLAARNRMRNTTNAFDGIGWWLGSNEKWLFRAFISRPVNIEPEEFDSSDSQRYFWGAYLQVTKARKLQTDLYYLGLHEDERTITRGRYSTIGGRLYKDPTPGEIDYEIESAWQFGTDQGRDHFAHFQHAELGYVFDSVWDSRLSFHYDYAAGDSDPEDDRSGRFSTLYGARRFEFNPTGIYGPFFRANLRTPGIRLVFYPANGLELLASHRCYWLAQAKDAWVGSGLRDPSGAAGSSLGHHFEARIRWSPTGYAMIESGYAHFFKGSYLERVPGSPRTPDSDFFYVAIEVRTRF
jgi:hypothetical protein